MPPVPSSSVLRTFVAVTAIAAWMTTFASLQAVAQTAAGGFSGFATSTMLHADALRTDESRLADVEVSFSGASIDSDGYASAIRNEMGRTVSPAARDKRSAARGAALEAGLNVAGDDDNQLIVAGKAETAMPGGEPSVRELGPVNGAPLAWASLLSGRADARYTGENQCVLGEDASRGTSGIADVMLLETGETLEDGRLGAPLLALDAPNPERVVVGSVSRTRFVAQTDKAGKALGTNAGLMSETRLTMLPVTLFKNTDNETTIEVLGEWVLRVVATGVTGGAWVHFGPADTTPETPVLRVIRSGEVQTILRAQDILGDAGAQVVIPGVGEIAVGEDARAIGGEFASAPTVRSDGTAAAAAADVVRIRLLSDNGVADVRLGHMEASVAVPAGGVACALPVAKTPNPGTVPVGSPFTTDIVITNPYDCDLQDIAAIDEIAVTGDARYRVDNVSDAGTYSGNDATGSVAWNALGTIDPGKSRQLSVAFTATAGPGTINDTVVVTGTCGVGDSTGTTTVQVTVTGTATVSVDVSGTRVLGVRTELPATGVPAGVLALTGVSMLGAGALLRRFTLRGR